MGIPVLNYSVYMHKNKLNGKVYIGVTKQKPKRRFQKGYGYKYSNKNFWSDIEKYGWDNFEHIILKSNISKEEASEIESEYVIRFDSRNPNKGYNQIDGGFKPNRPDVSLLMSMRVGKLNPNYGKPAPESVKNALINYAKYRQFGANNPRAVSVIQFNKKAEPLNIFQSVADAERYLNVKSSHIIECCKGQRKSSNGYVWQYERRNDLSVFQS